MYSIQDRAEMLISGILELVSALKISSAFAVNKEFKELNFELERVKCCQLISQCFASCCLVIYIVLL